MKRKVLLVLFGFILGIVVSGTCAYAATLYEAREVAYDNSSSGTSNVNVQTALDELYKKVGDLTGKQLKYEVIDSSYLSGGSGPGGKTITLNRDYLYVFSVAHVVRDDTPNQTVYITGTCNPVYISQNANWNGGSTGNRYRRSTAVAVNTKKGQTLKYGGSWLTTHYAIGIYEQ